MSEKGEDLSDLRQRKLWLQCILLRKKGSFYKIVACCNNNDHNMKYCHPLVRSIIFGQSYSQTGQSNGQNIKIRCNNVETAPTDATTLPQLRTWPNIRSEEIIAQTSTLLPLNKITLTVPTLRNHAITPLTPSSPSLAQLPLFPLSTSIPEMALLLI